MASKHKIGEISDASLRWIFVAQGASIAPLLMTLPVWILLIWLSALAWRWQIQRRRWPFPTLGAKVLMGALSVAGILASYSRVSGVEPMIGFLVCAFALKLVELRTNKDVLTVLFIGFIAIAGQFLFAQSILSAAFALLACVVLITAWQAAFTSRKKPIATHFKQGGVLIGQSVPFMVVLFLVMPRLGPLWSVPLPQEQEGTTGFSSELKIGEIGRLAQSGEPAFRVAFDGGNPVSSDLYWRGLVLEQFDGETWRPSFSQTATQAPVVVALPTTRYSVILEPHYQRWLFALGVPVAAHSETLQIDLHPGSLLRAKRPVVNKSQYVVESIVSLPALSQPLDATRIRELTEIPPGSNPRAVELARSWADAELTPSQIVEAALSLYNQTFVYTLRPPLLPEPAIDSFLFATRAGFCEHFASSFVFLMRAAGVPARLVVGYQGGQYNSVEDYYLVKQSDAHAWAEVWLAGEGWRRVDPTAAVAPNRVQLGVEDALAPDDRALVQGAWREAAWLRGVFSHLDAVGYSWNRWVLNYDNETKIGFLTRLLGGVDPWRVGVAFVLVSGATIVSIWLWPLLDRKRSRPRIEHRMLQPVFAKLERQGLSRRPEETLLQFVDRVEPKVQRIEERRALRDVVDQYHQLVYAGQDSLAKFKRSVERFVKA